MTTMQYVGLGAGSTEISRIVYGCMGIGGDGSRGARATAERAVRAALDAGITAFDHADIYGGGQCEMFFGDILRGSPGLRERLVIMTKCGIRFADGTSPKHYNLSYDYIVRSVEGSLTRLSIERIDVLMLHRPDYLMAADDVARAFAKLIADGKVAEVGVSNFRPRQFSLLQSRVGRPLVANQVEINLHNLSAFEDGTLEQCQQDGVAPLAWSPLAGIAYPAKPNRIPAVREASIKQELDEQCERYAATPAQVALAWLLRHPARIAPIVGSLQPERISQAVAALAIDYTRDDWYRLLEARNGTPVP